MVIWFFKLENIVMNILWLNVKFFNVYTCTKWRVNMMCHSQDFKGKSSKGSLTLFPPSWPSLLHCSASATHTPSVLIHLGSEPKRGGGCPACPLWAWQGRSNEGTTSSSGRCSFYSPSLSNSYRGTSPLINILVLAATRISWDVAACKITVLNQ